MKAHLMIKKVTCAKNNYSIHSISLIIICLLFLLAIICVSRYFYYTKYRSKQPFYDISIKLEKLAIKYILQK